MRSNRGVLFTLIALMIGATLALAGCKASGMALTKRGQLLKININHPVDLPEAGEDNLDVIIGSRGVRSVKDVLVDVELPSQLIVVDETRDRGITMTHDPGSNTYHYIIGDIQSPEDSHIRYKVRTAFGTLSETGSMKVTAWQRDLPGDKLIETAVIKLRR